LVYEVLWRHAILVNFPPEWGTEPVPLDKRVLRSFDCFFLWFSLAVGLLVLQAGGLLIHLSTVGILAVAIFGSLIGSLMLGLAGGLGSKYGVPTMVSLRAVLGLQGSYLPTVLNVLQLVGWSSFEILIMADSALLITGSFLGAYTLHFWIVVFAVWCMILSIGGPLVVIRQWLEKFAIWFTTGTTVFITYIVVSHFPQVLAFQGDGTMPITLAIDLVIAMPISWWPLISDYTRFSKTERGAFVGTTAGYTVANAWFYTLGALLVLAYVNQTIISAIVSITFGGLALLILLADETDNGFADIYSGAVSMQNLRPKAKQWKLILAITVISVFLAAVIPSNWQFSYQNFLIFIGAIFVPLLGVLAMDFYVIRKKQYSLDEFYSSARNFRAKPIASWFAGIAAYFAFYYLTTIGSSLPAFAISALMLYVLERVPAGR
jgi:NCS1 family nucleobase:cation symporter-1